MIKLYFLKKKTLYLMLNIGLSYLMNLCNLMTAKKMMIFQVLRVSAKQTRDFFKKQKQNLSRYYSCNYTESERKAKKQLKKRTPIKNNGPLVV